MGNHENIQVTYCLHLDIPDKDESMLFIAFQSCGITDNQ